MGTSQFSLSKLTDIARTAAFDTVIYGFGTALTSGIAILLLPLYLMYMSPSGFGALNLARTVPVFLMILVTLSLPGAVMRFYYEWEERDIEREAVFTLTIFLSLMAALFSIIVLVYGEMIFGLLIRSIDFDPLIKYAVLSEIATVPLLLSTKLMRAKGEPKIYLAVCVIMSVLIVCLSYYFVVVMQGGAVGAIKAFFYANITVMVLAYIYLFYNSRPRIHKAVFSEAILYSIPLIPGSFVSGVFSIIDRFILEKIVSSNELGIYAAARSITNVITMMGSLLQMALFPLIMRIMVQREEKDREAALMLEYFSYVIIFTGIVVFMFSSDFLEASSNGYENAANYVYLLTIFCVIKSLNTIPITQIAIAKKNIYEAYGSFIEAGIFAMTVYVLTTWLGTSGMILAFCVAALVCSVFLFYQGRILYPLTWNSSRLLKKHVGLIVVVAAVAALGMFEHTSWYLVSFKVLVVLSLVLFLVFEVIKIYFERLRT